MATRTLRLTIWLAALLLLSNATGCGTPPWRASRSETTKPADDVGLDLARLPTGVRVAYENGLFRDDGEGRPQVGDNDKEIGNTP
jgi:hypothetical protein